MFAKPIIREEVLSDYNDIKKGDIFKYSNADSTNKLFLGIKIIKDDTVLFFCEEELLRNISNNIVAINLNRYPYDRFTLRIVSKNAYQVGNIYRYYEPINGSEGLEVKRSYINITKTQ